MQFRFKLIEVLEHVDANTPLSDNFSIDGVTYQPVGLLPCFNPGAKFKGVTLADLFYLEPPKTYGDLKRRVDHYDLNVDIVTELVA